MFNWLKKIRKRNEMENYLKEENVENYVEVNDKLKKTEEAIAVKEKQLFKLCERISESENRLKRINDNVKLLEERMHEPKSFLADIEDKIRSRVYVEAINSARQYSIWGNNLFLKYPKTKEHIDKIFSEKLAINGDSEYLLFLDNKVPQQIWEMCNDYLKINILLLLKKYKNKPLETLMQELAITISFVQKSLDLYDYKIDKSYIEYLYAYLTNKYEMFLKSEEERERIVEEKKAQQEYARAIKQAQKDEEKAQFEIEKRQAKLQEAKTQEQLQKLNEEIAKLQAALKDAIERRERAISMAQQTKSGYVYVISNIGSFGEGIYKIGMTRRLDPMERIFELGNASVPFPFDVHTFIYSEDAPALEAYLHKVFDNKKVNTVNYRKEYFRTTLDEIKNALIRKGIEADFIEEPPAYQYRESCNMYYY